jgi:hypothetical protein
MTDPKKCTIKLPSFLEITGHGTSLGKSLIATTAALVYRQAGYDVTMVRIESKLIRHREGDIFIATENFAQAAGLVGGLAGVVDPMLEAFETIKPGKSAVITDWGGGQADHRAQIFVATRIGERLKAMGISATSVIVTTNAASDMARAAELLHTSAMIAPDIHRCLALNRRRGPFNFVNGSEQSRVYSRLREEAKSARTFEVRAVGGESWKVCDEAGMSMPEVIESDIETLSARIAQNRFIAGACQTEVAAWYSATEAELLRVLALPNAAKS